MTLSVSGDSITFPDLSTQLTAPSGFGFKNRIINGDMRIDQRNAGAAVNSNAAVNPYTVDRWRSVAFAGSNQFSIQQSAVAPTGFVSSLLATALTVTTVTSTDAFAIRQPIEGFNCADIGFGTASASVVTLSFWVRSSLTGTFGGAIQNQNANRSYPFTYPVTAANTWEYKTVTIAGDTAGTWHANSSGGINLWLGLGVGATLSGTAGAWASANYASATGAVSLVGTSGATFYVTGVQLEKGSTATAFDYLDYGRSLIQCQRYFCHSNAAGASPDVNATAYLSAGLASDIEDAALASVMFPVLMRATPSMTVGRLYSYNGSLYKTITSIYLTAQGIGYMNHDAGNTGGSAYVLGRPYKFSWIASAEL